MEYYVVIMRRYGDFAGHSYVAGVFDNKYIASIVGKKEEYDRARKYSRKIVKINSSNVFCNYEIEDIDKIKMSITKKPKDLSFQLIKDSKICKGIDSIENWMTEISQALDEDIFTEEEYRYFFKFLVE